MGAPLISVVIPTIDGREEHLSRCVSSYLTSYGDYNIEMIVIENKPTCGEAWISGAKQATGEYIHFSADDLEAHPEWAVSAVAMTRLGAHPSPYIYSPTGVLEFGGEHFQQLPHCAQTRMSVIPFLTRRMLDTVGELLPIHYYTDDWISWRLWRAGIKTLVAPGYSFVHHRAQHGRGAGMTENERMEADLRAYQDAVAGSMST